MGKPCAAVSRCHPPVTRLLVLASAVDVLPAEDQRRTSQKSQTLPWCFRGDQTERPAVPVSHAVSAVWPGGVLPKPATQRSSGSGRGWRRRGPWPPRAACAAAMAGRGAPGMSSKAPSANLRRRERPLRSAAPRMPASSFAGNPRLRRAARTWSLPSATRCYDTPWALALRRQQRQQHNQGQNQQRHGCPLAKEVN